MMLGYWGEVIAGNPNVFPLRVNRHRLAAAQECVPAERHNDAHQPAPLMFREFAGSTARPPSGKTVRVADHNNVPLSQAHSPNGAARAYVRRLVVAWTPVALTVCDGIDRGRLRPGRGVVSTDSRVLAAVL
jgi:hypothetical protein